MVLTPVGSLKSGLDTFTNEALGLGPKSGPGPSWVTEKWVAHFQGVKT